LKGGCYSCAGADDTATGAVNVITNIAYYDNAKCAAPTTFTDSFILAAGAAASTATLTGCADGYSLVPPSTSVCTSCDDAAVVTAMASAYLLDTSNSFGMKTCVLSSTSTITSYTCKDKYIK